LVNDEPDTILAVKIEEKEYLYLILKR